MPVLSEMARIITRLADCGVFWVGVLVGTIAYQILGPL